MSKKNTSAIIGGLGYVMSVFTELIAYVRELGGSDDDLYRLATPEGKEALRQMAELIVQSGNGKKLKNEFVMVIDRSKPFNPAELLGEGWTIEEQDERSLAFTQVDLSRVQLVTCLKDRESIKGEERLNRLKAAGHIRLDAEVFQRLWKNKSLIPESWKEKTGGNTTSIFFDGTILRSPHGDRCVLYLYFRDGMWRWSCVWLGHGWGAGDPSAVLAN